MLKIIKKKYTIILSDSLFSEILKGSVWAFLARGFSALFALAASMIIAKKYGAEMIGVIAVINSFLFLASIITVMGTNTSILRLIPENIVKYSHSSAFHVYRKSLYMVIGASVVVGLVSFFMSETLAGKLFSKPNLSKYFVLSSCVILFKSLVDFNTHAVRGLKLINGFALMQILPQGVNLLILILIGVFTSCVDVPVYAFLAGIVVTGIFGIIIMEISFKKRSRPDDKVQKMSTKEIISISIPMLMTSTMVFIIGQTGVVMLGVFRSTTEVGYYDIAVKMAMLTTFILTAVNAMAAPKFSELFHSNNLEDLFYVAKKTAKLIFWTTIPILLLIIIFGKKFLAIFFGYEFVQAYPLLTILVVGQFVNSMSGSTGFFMNMTGNHNAFQFIMIFTAIINLLLNYFLIKSIGSIGAAFTAMVSMILWNSLILLYLKIKFGKTTGYFPFLDRIN